jgi:hypothetical protein
MVAAIRRVSRPLLACVLAFAALMASAGPAAASKAQYEKAYALGLEAYTYGLPLLETNKTFLTQTSINVSNGNGYGPVNQFNSVRNLTNPTSTAVVAPGSNGLSSIAWVDLTAGPEVLHVPNTLGHSFVLALVDPYTEDFRNLGDVTHTKPGYYVITGPGQHNVQIPAGTQRIDVDYTRIWIIGSTQVKGKSDLPTVHLIQDGYTLTPLSQFGHDDHPQPPAHPITKVTTYQLPSGLRFFDVMGQLLKEFPPPADNAPELRLLAHVGIGPGMEPSKNPHLSSDTLKGLRAAVAAGPKRIQEDLAELYLKSFRPHDGYFLGGFGHYGTNYKLRAVIAQIGLGAVTSDQTIFAISTTDHSLGSLSGSGNYILHMPAPPPVNGGWSLTVYTLQGFLVPNPINRYELSNASPLVHSGDGSVDIYLQASRPTDPAHVDNWLPTPAGKGFEVIWRLIAPKPTAIPSILDGFGWQPPAIREQPVQGLG